jgi:hypothetical protein
VYKPTRIKVPVGKIVLVRPAQGYNRAVDRQDGIAMPKADTRIVTKGSRADYASSASPIFTRIKIVVSARLRQDEALASEKRNSSRTDPGTPDIVTKTNAGSGSAPDGRTHDDGDIPNYYRVCMTEGRNAE